MENSRHRRWLEENHLIMHAQGRHGIALVPVFLRVANCWVHKIMLYIAEIALALMVVIVFTTVVLRYCFNTGIGWAEEVPRLLVTLFAFLACAIGVRDHMHIAVDILYNRFPKGGSIRKFLDVFADVCVLVCGLFLLICGWNRVALLMTLPGVLPMTGWPTWVQYIPAPMAGFLMTFDSMLFLTHVLDPNDLLYSKKEIDYREIVKNQEKSNMIENGGKR